MTPEHTHCLRCGRPLADPERQADGMGLCCRQQEPHRRRLQHLGTDEAGNSRFTLYSLTLRGKAERYNITINFEDGTFSCTCPDHKFRGATCKHIKRACDYEARNRERMVA